MKLKTIALAVFLAANGAAYAAPTMQTCAPMEVTHNGNSGLSYSLQCDAGGWSLKYTGAVPAGTESVLARYRVQVSNPDGTTFSHSRSVRLPAPSLLGQALVREAVALDNGDLALRDCEEFSCTLYRPLGNAEKLAKSTITVTPEIKRLTAEAARLNAELAQRQGELNAQNVRMATLQAEVATLSAKLGGTEQTLVSAKAALDSAKEQYTADIDGLLKSSKVEMAKAAAAAGAQTSAQVAQLNAQLASVSAALDAARKELAECAAAHGVAEQAKAKADAEVKARADQVAELQRSLKAAEAELNRVLDSVDSKVADLNGKHAQANVAQSAEVASMRLKLDAATREVEGLLTKVAGLERSLSDANAQLKVAQAAQVEHTGVLSTAAESQERLRAVLEMSLAEAQITIAELTTARASQVGALQASLADANEKLAAAQAQLATHVVDTAAPAALSQSDLATATARIDALTTKVAALEQELSTAAAELAEAHRIQAAKDEAYEDLSSAYENNLGQLAASHTAAAAARTGTVGNVDAALLGEKLSTTVAERDAALAEVAQLTARLAAIGPQVDKLEAARQGTMKDAQKVATEMLKALDMIQDLQAAKAEADKALEATTARLMEMSTKLEAATLARNLAMQAATTAHADADAQNLKNQTLAKQLAQAGSEVTAVTAQRDQLAAENAGQALEIAALRKQLAELKGNSSAQVKPQSPVRLDEAD
jgi:chromosome segregation ATPase